MNTALTSNDTDGFHQWKQKVFDIVAPALLKQGVRSVDGSGLCRFRGEDGRKCAIGFLIKDEFYDPYIEHWSFRTTAFLNILNKSGVFDGWRMPQPDSNRNYLLCPEADFMGGLQTIHDNHDPENWKEHLMKFAGYHGLDPSCISG